jgi:hypothetical protein
MKSFLLAAALTVSSMAIAQSTETEEMQPPGQDQTTIPPAEDVTPPETNPTPSQPTEPAQTPEQMPPEQMPPEQTTPTMPTTTPPTEPSTPTQPSTPPTPSTTAQPTMAATGTPVEPGNTKPERDARGIPVISDPATAPAGANQMVSAAPGSQVVANPNQGQVFASMAATGSYPACSRTVTDHCAQKYEHSRRRR